MVTWPLRGVSPLISLLLAHSCLCNILRHPPIDFCKPSLGAVSCFPGLIVSCRNSGLSICRLWCSGLPSDNTVSYMHMKLSVTASLPYDLVLGRDWLFFYCQTLPHAAFHLSSRTVEPGLQPSGTFTYPFSQFQSYKFLPQLFCPQTLCPSLWILILLRGVTIMSAVHFYSIPTSILPDDAASSWT
jgi:hypothetical protein